MRLWIGLCKMHRASGQQWIVTCIIGISTGIYFFLTVENFIAEMLTSGLEFDCW